MKSIHYILLRNLTRFVYSQTLLFRYQVQIDHNQILDLKVPAIKLDKTMSVGAVFFCRTLGHYVGKKRSGRTLYHYRRMLSNVGRLFPSLHFGSSFLG